MQQDEFLGKTVAISVVHHTSFQFPKLHFFFAFVRLSSLIYRDIINYDKQFEMLLGFFLRNLVLYVNWGVCKCLM